MPVLKGPDNQPIYIEFNKEGNALVAVFDWTIGTKYQLVFDPASLDVTRVVIRIPEKKKTSSSKSETNGDYSLWYYNKESDGWGPASVTAETSIHTNGQNRIFKLRTAWAAHRLRLDFMPGSQVRWIEICNSEDN